MSNKQGNVAMQLDFDKIIKEMTLASVRQYRSFDTVSDEDLEKLYENRLSESVLIDSLCENAKAALKALAREFLSDNELFDQYKKFLEDNKLQHNLLGYSSYQGRYINQLKEFGNE